MAKGEERKGIVFYYEWQDQIRQLPPETQLQVIWGILTYDETGKKLETDDPLLSAFMDKFYFEVDKQKQNWETRAGRPAKYQFMDFIPLFSQGLSNKEVAARIGCSERTALRKRKEYEEMFPDQ